MLIKSCPHRTGLCAGWHSLNVKPGQKPIYEVEVKHKSSIELRKLGLKLTSEQKDEDIFMPKDDPSIGFNTKWYPEGFQKAIDYSIDADNTVKILTAPYFIATKLEAFNDRGKGDGRTSHDFEDVIFVLENRSSIWEEMNSLEGAIKEYLLAEFTKLLSNPHIFEWIDSHAERGSPPASYSILQALKKFTGS